MTEVTIKIRMKDFSTDTIADIAKAVKKIGDGATLSHIHTQEVPSDSPPARQYADEELHTLTQLSR